MKNRYLRIVLSLILTSFLGLGWWVPSAKADTENQKLIAEVWRIVNQSYVDETFNHQNWWLVRQNAMKQRIKSREEAYSVIGKMLASLDDPFTRHLQPSQYRNLQVSTSGELTGVGIQIALDEETGALQVITPIAGSPAQKAGIKPGDRILKIDGVSSTLFTLDEAAAQMRGPKGTQVVLTVARQEEEAQEVTIVRDRIALNPVIAELRSSPGSVPVGYIRLNQFNGNAVAEVTHAISSLEKQGADAYILDLRNNPGGLLQAGIEIARLWLDQGTIVYTVNRQGILGSFEATNVALTNDPLVVLVNRGTASASEILAGALQDNQRAQIVGEKSFGKGLIQSLFDLSDGSGLAVTVAKYETPNHHDINKLGITPDRIISWEPTAFNQIATEVDQQYRTAFELLTTPPVVANAS